jgi:hypothetical protein
LCLICKIRNSRRIQWFSIKIDYWTQTRKWRTYSIIYLLNINWYSRRSCYNNLIIIIRIFATFVTVFLILQFFSTSILSHIILRWINTFLWFQSLFSYRFFAHIIDIKRWQLCSSPSNVSLIENFFNIVNKLLFKKKVYLRVFRDPNKLANDKNRVLFWAKSMTRPKLSLAKPVHWLTWLTPKSKALLPLSVPKLKAFWAVFKPWK